MPKKKLNIVQPDKTPEIKEREKKLDLGNKETRPKLLATRIFQLGGKHKLTAVNMLLPPGVKRFFVERIDGHHIRFFVEMDEVMSLVDSISKKAKEKKSKIAEATKPKEVEAEA